MILQGSWALQNIYDMDMLGAVGFIQDNAGKEVQQAANSSEDPLTPLYDTEVTVTAVENISETNCLGVVTPVVTIRNNGGNEVTSMNIHYHVNGEELHTVPWSGSLSFLESAIIGLPEISFSIEDMNDLVIYTSDPNGITDEYVKNDTLHHEFAKAVVAPTIINFLIRTDTHPEEITWEILNSGGGVVHSGGPYTQANTMISQELEINDEDCYQFRIYDSGGDGLILPGFYALYYGGSNYIATGTEFGSIDTAYFSVSTGTGFAELNSSLDIHVYPNPVKDRLNLDFFLEKPASVSVEVIDLSGNVVILEGFGWQEQGPARLQLRTSSLATGTYFLRIRAGEYTYHERFVKAQ